MRLYAIKTYEIDKINKIESWYKKWCHKAGFFSKALTYQGCGNTMVDLSNLLSFLSGQVIYFCLLVLGQV